MTSTIQSSLKQLAHSKRPLLARSLRPRPCTPRCYSTTKQADPLRILFCGSDQFSINALQALHAEQTRSPRTIEAIDVVCRPPKRVGAKFKKIREVPIKGVARELCLPIHDVDTFTGWTPPNPFNLIIAVSFGLLVPKRLIHAAKYGGLNLHPSLLPDFRGPAPLHHTLLQRESQTGVSLQTLHPARFDHGIILDQQAFEIPDPEECTVPVLTDLVSIIGAEMLVAAIQQNLFVPPLKPVASWSGAGVDEAALRHAPKIQKEDMHVDWARWRADEVVRRKRVLGPVWSFAAAQGGKKVRVIMDDVRLIEVRYEESLLRILKTLDVPREDVMPGMPFALVEDVNGKTTDGDQPVFIKTCDGTFLRIDTMKVEGSRVAPAYRASMKARLFAEKPVVKGGSVCGIWYFRDCLS